MAQPTPSHHHASRFTPHVSRLTPSILFLALILLFCHKLAFSNLILARGDTFLYFYPYWQAAADAWRSGRLPLWNPHLFMGAPLLANSQVGFFYPLNWPLWWLLPTPYAVNAAILLHLFIAAWGTYLAARRVLALGATAALLAAVCFGLGGYLTAQVEHVNQLQGLAWLPWVLAVLAGRQGAYHRHAIAQKTIALALLFALQLTAGHSQTTFITGVAALIYLLAHTIHSSQPSVRTPQSAIHTPQSAIPSLLPLILGSLLALLLTAVQLLPTLELSRFSARQGGLPANEVLSFSLHPLLLTRSLLPSYGQSLFSEYVAFLPVTVLLLAFVGGWQWRQRPGALAAVLLVTVGLLLALGAFNPLYWLLAHLPGFNLFRVPARWLALYALGLSLLAGLGWQVVWERWQQRRQGRQTGEPTLSIRRPLRFGFLALVSLIVWSVVATFLARYITTGPEAPYEAPALLTLLTWVVEGSLVYLVLAGWRLQLARQARLPLQWKQVRLVSPLPLVVLALFILFMASRSLPYNNLTTPEAYFDLRPPVARLLAETTDQQPPGRLLSLSGIFFDPGDQVEIHTIYEDQLPPEALYDYIITVKHKEVLSPNLPLAYGLASVDGFDGGILPLLTYSQLMQLILPEGVATSDGRLREFLVAVPDARWLDLFNVRYLISDKVGDVWRDGIFFDLQHPARLEGTDSLAIGHVPVFVATELRLIAAGMPGDVIVTTVAGQTWRLPPELMDSDLYHVHFPEAAVAQAITLMPAVTPVQVQGLTLVNATDNTFQPLIPGQYRLIHSGDVKIYENLDALPRAFIVHDWQWQPDTAAALAVMQAREFDPGQTAVLLGQGSRPLSWTGPPGQAEIIAYTPERVVIHSDSQAPGLLLLTDTCYPGWRATVDGTAMPIYQADILFRGVMVPAGRHEVAFTFAPSSFRIGQVLSLIGLILLIAIGIFTRPWR